MVKQGDIFEYDFGFPVDNRQAGRRPAIVVQTDLLNDVQGYQLTLVVPVTTKGKPGVPTHILIQPADSNGLTEISFAKCEQIHTVAKPRLGARMGSVSKEQLYLIKVALRNVLNL